MWQRAAAFLIDLLPLAVLAVIENAAGVAARRDVGFLNLLLMVGYFAGMNYRFGGTIGKLAMGLRVALPSSPQVPVLLLARAIVKLVCLAPPLATVYGILAIWRNDGRSLADFAAGSTVVEAATLKTPLQLSLFERLLATLLALVAPWVLLLALFVGLFGLLLTQELISRF